MKNKIIYILTFLFSLIISFVLCYFYFDRIINKFSGILGSNISFLIMRFFIAVIIFLVIDSIIKRKFSRSELNILLISYFILILIMSLFKYDSKIYSNINLNPLNIINDFEYTSTTIVVFGNLLMYIPIGIGIKLNFKKVKNYKLYILFLLYILIVESIQFIFKLGIFDINDIILNFIGFYIGIYIKQLFIKGDFKWK